MPTYPCRCPEHGDFEAFRYMSARDTLVCEAAPLKNPVRPERGRRRCFMPVEQVMVSTALPGVRIDAAGESSTDPRRLADGSAHFNIGLPGVDTVVGTRPDGKPQLAYRPRTHHEVGSNANAREIAKRHGLEMMGSGAYRTVPK